MAISKKGKRILWIAIPVAVLAIAALLVWLLLGQPEPEKPFEILRSQTTGNIVDCQLREGAVEATGDGSTPQPYYTFPQTPEGWTLLGGDTVQVGETLEKYQNQDGEVLALLSTTGPATLFEVETGTTHFYLPFTGGMGWAELEDQSSVQDATVNGNPAFVHINEEVSEIAWIDGCCTLQLRSTAPLTQEELVALAESVQGDVYYNVQGE